MAYISIRMAEYWKIEPIIYIEVKTGFVPYIVLTNDYNGKKMSASAKTIL